MFFEKVAIRELACWMRLHRTKNMQIFALMPNQKELGDDFMEGIATTLESKPALTSEQVVEIINTAFDKELRAQFHCEGVSDAEFEAAQENYNQRVLDSPYVAFLGQYGLFDDTGALSMERYVAEREELHAGFKSAMALDYPEMAAEAVTEEINLFEKIGLSVSNLDAHTTGAKVILGAYEAELQRRQLGNTPN
jgi:hypothetical protein